jgi:hypothetical protein
LPAALAAAPFVPVVVAERPSPERRQRRVHQLRMAQKPVHRPRKASLPHMAIHQPKPKMSVQSGAVAPDWSRDHRRLQQW